MEGRLRRGGADVAPTSVERDSATRRPSKLVHIRTWAPVSTPTFPHGVIGSCSLEGVWGSSVALGVIAGKCGSLRLVLGGPVGCLRGRWRSGPRKWRHDAGSKARVSKHRAPVGALRLDDHGMRIELLHVSTHRAPVGLLRRVGLFIAHSPVGVWKYSALEFP